MIIKEIISVQSIKNKGKRFLLEYLSNINYTLLIYKLKAQSKFLRKLADYKVVYNNNIIKLVLILNLRRRNLNNFKIKRVINVFQNIIITNNNIIILLLSVKAIILLEDITSNISIDQYKNSDFNTK